MTHEPMQGKRERGTHNVSPAGNFSSAVTMTSSLQTRLSDHIELSYFMTDCSSSVPTSCRPFGRVKL